MTEHDEKRFIYNGHAIGAGAHVHRLDNHSGLDIQVPTQGASVLPVTGGLSESKASNFLYAVDRPVKRRILSVQHVDTKAHGRHDGKLYRTGVQTTVEHSTWAERVHFDLLSLKMETTHNGIDAAPVIFIKDLKIEGVHLGSVTANVEVDEEPFSNCGTWESLADFWAKASNKYKQENAARFPVHPSDPTKLVPLHAYYHCSVVRKITLSGPANEIAQMRVDGNTIIWDDPKDHSVGFGKISLGEVLVSGTERRITLARMQMGCPTGGSGTGGEGQSNGGPGA